MLELIPHALLMSMVIIIPSIMVARQEVQIEGPFGWSSMTFTKRYPTNHWFSKIYRALSGQDKWATSYHANSNSIWFLLFISMFFFFPFYNRLAGVFDNSALTAIIVLAFCSFLEMAVIEDYLWFLIHPYYGPDRHNSKFIPWFQNFQGGIPFTYWLGMSVTIILTALTAWLLKNPEVFYVWIITLVITNFFCFVVVKK